MYPLERREQEIFATVRALQGCSFVIIGGYAVNAYTLPRFSVDCDIVVRGESDAKRIERILSRCGYVVEPVSEARLPYHGEFVRYEKELEKGFRVSVDMLIGKVVDRQTGAVLTADWIFGHSSLITLRGKTIAEGVRVLVPQVGALVVMKLLSCRKTDIRDIFMMLPLVKDKAFVQREVSARADFKKQLTKVQERVSSKEFRNGLQGVFGLVRDDVFEKHKTILLRLER